MHCNPLLYGLPKHLINKIQSVQNAAARIIAKKRKNDHISAVLQQLHWLPVEYRIMFKINLVTFKCLHDMAPIYLRELLHVYTPNILLRSSFKAVRLETVNLKLKLMAITPFQSTLLTSGIPCLKTLDPYIVCHPLNLSSKLTSSNLLLICINIF